MSLRLYNYALSGNCYKLRLMMKLLGLSYATVPINFFPEKEHKSAAFLAINPLGQVPVLDDGEFRLRDAQAILVYLASRYDPDKSWYPDDAHTRGRITLWLSVAEDLTRSSSAARLHDGFGYDNFDIRQCRSEAHRLFAMMEEHLADGEMDGARWLAAPHATIADIACFPYVALAPEGGMSLDHYPALRRWISAVKSIEGFTGMSGILELGIDGPTA